ncbi:MAG: DegV family protein [Chloroflexi bacterium]|nr:DegV family protein [Chloroflexota bacterium]
MHIVSDRGMDLALEQMQGLNIHLVPLTFTLDGKTYRSGVDIQPTEFYKLLASTESFPTTSQPSPGDFADLYRELAKTDPEILSIHISSGLSGTLNSAHAGAEMVPEARVTFVDTKTLSGAEGWQVFAAARAAQAGWAMDKIIELLDRIRAVTDTIYTLAELKYLIHGGRISHMKGLIASVLNIKPIIGVEKVLGKYAQYGQARSFEKAILKLADHIASQYKPGIALRAQIMHAFNPDGAQFLRQRMDELFKCTWLPVGPIAPVLGAHTGPSLVGIAYAPLDAFPEIP